MAEKIRFYTDEHIGKAVIRGLRRRGVDVLTAPEAKMLGAEDKQHLQFAVEQERTIVTQDRDFLRLNARGTTHAGIAYAPQDTPTGKMVSGLMLIHEVLTQEEMKNHVEFL